MGRAVGFVLMYFSAVWLPCVSAGGAYCAKAARARAAALGLKYPGDHGAPDLSVPRPYSAPRPRAPQHQLLQNNPRPAAMNYNMLYNPPEEFPHIRPAGYGGLFQPNPLSGLYGGEELNNRQAERVVNPRTLNRLPGMVEFLDEASESHESRLQLPSNVRGGLRGRSPSNGPRHGFYNPPHPRGAPSQHGAVSPSGGPRKSQWRSRTPCQMYGKMKPHPRSPCNKLRKS